MRSFSVALPVLLCTLPFYSAAQSFSAKPVRLVIGFPPGGGDDYHARVMAQKLTELIGQQVIVDYKSGAGGVIGFDHVAKSAPDGYTLGMMGASLAAATHIYRKFPFDPLRDLAPVSRMTLHQLMLVVHPSVPARNVVELIALARARPGKLSYSSSGIGATPHLSGALFASMTGVNIVHVPYRGGSGSMLDLIAGQVDMTFGTIPSALPHVRSGKMRALAVSGSRRATIAPDVPTVAEAGVPGFALDSWYALFAPGGTPKEIVTQFNAATAKALASAEVRERLIQVGSEPMRGTPEELTELLKKDLVRFGEIVRIAGAKVD